MTSVCLSVTLADCDHIVQHTPDRCCFKPAFHNTDIDTRPTRRHTLRRSSRGCRQHVDVVECSLYATIRRDERITAAACLLRHCAGIAAELQKPLVYGGRTTPDNGPVPRQSAPDFGEHEATQQGRHQGEQRAAVRLPAPGENLHALQRLGRHLFGFRSLLQSASSNGNC